MANGYIHIGTMAGKLNGVMPTQTPSGSRTVRESMPRATSFSESPIIRLGIPHATSTIWMPRRTSNAASSVILPFSLRENSGDFVRVFFQQRFEAVQRLDAVDHGRVLPLLKSRVGGILLHG